MKNKGNYTTLNDLWNDSELLTEVEKEKIEFEVELIGKVIKAREEKGLTQKELAELAGIQQPALARLENMKATPQIDTLFKILKPLGYKLAVVKDCDDLRAN